jgi:hypothetical protein
MKRIEWYSALALALFIAVLILLAAFFADNRPGHVDELALYNPAYMLARHHQLTYPAYLNFYKVPVIVHPPIHAGLIGLFRLAGMTWYYAEAFPTLIFLLLSLWTVMRGPFPAPVRLSLLFGVGFVMTSTPFFGPWFGTRPDGHVHVAWMAGLLLLEASRLRDWSPRGLFAGAFVLTWAAGVHYYFGLAFLGVAPYLIWVVKSLGWKEARPRVLSLFGGGLLFGLPYLAFYVAPYATEILAQFQFAQNSGGSATSFELHRAMYRWFASLPITPLVRAPMSLGAPLLFLSTPLLLAIRSTRGIAMAAIPPQLLMAFGMRYRQPHYLLPEIVLFVTAATVVAAVAFAWLLGRTRSSWLRATAAPSLALLFGGYLYANYSHRPFLDLSGRPMIHEGDLARAATRKILGPGARVTGRVAAWYTSGGDHWFTSFYDMLSDPPMYPDRDVFFARLDAAADYTHGSSDVWIDKSRRSLSAEYARGYLKLRGFFIGESDGDLGIVLLHRRAAARLVGYGVAGRRLYRFEQHDGGDYRVLSAACPELPELNFRSVTAMRPMSLLAAQTLPQPDPGGHARMFTLVAPAAGNDASRRVRAACQVLGEVPGTLQPDDKYALVDELRRQDPPIRFYPRLELLPPPAAAPGP